jgi:hypothetical protein
LDKASREADFRPSRAPHSAFWPWPSDATGLRGRAHSRDLPSGIPGDQRSRAVKNEEQPIRPTSSFPAGALSAESRRRPFETSERRMPRRKLVFPALCHRHLKPKPLESLVLTDLRKRSNGREVRQCVDPPRSTGCAVPPESRKVVLNCQFQISFRIPGIFEPRGPSMPRGISMPFAGVWQMHETCPIRRA